MSLTIHMMTAALAPGDAIGNYILSLTRLLQGWGCTVYLYADHPDSAYPLPHLPSAAYQPTGQDMLWLHFSIYSENVHVVETTPDFVVFDSHNVSPPHLFAGYDPHMEWLCKQGEATLDGMVPYADLVIVHTDYVWNDLLRRGYRRLRKLPIVVDTSRFTGAESAEWSPLLSQLPYLLFVGRIVPQKNLRVALQVFAELHRRRPEVFFFLVGGHSLPTYSAELEALADDLGIAEAVVFAGKFSQPEILTSFFRHARFLLMLSQWESFCVPLVEALYFQTPVLGHGVPPIPETMGPGGVVLEGSPAAMAAQVDALWDDATRYQRLQQAGQQHVQRFTDQQLAADLLGVFRELAADQG